MTRLRRERRNDKAAIMSVEMIKEIVRVDRVALRHALVIKSSHSLIRLAKKFQSHPCDAYLRQNHIQLAKSSQNHTLGRKTLHPHRIIVPSLSERPPQTGAVTAEKTPRPSSSNSKSTSRVHSVEAFTPDQKRRRH